MSDAPPLLEMRGIVKTFPGVRALSGVDLTLGHGEILALLGENGAGKSTLIKTLAGAHRPDHGVIRIHGEDAVLANPATARAAGIGVIYQEFSLVPYLTVSENIHLGRARARGGVVDRGAERRASAALLERLGAPINPDTPCARLSIAQQQIVEIAKALATDTRILVMDEPSATLTPQEVARLFTIIRELADQGIGVIYISHRLDEVFEIADRVTVLRDGSLVGTEPIGSLNRQRMIEMMVGRTVDNEFPKERHPIGPARLRVQGLRRGNAVRGVSFEARAGEVLALTGLVGAGRTETARLIFGADRADAGVVSLDGKRLRLRAPRDAIAAGICLLTEDRKGQGLVLAHSVRENFALPNLDRFSRGGVMRGGDERVAFDAHRAAMDIKISGPDQPAGTLSGGNQQKVVLAKWLERGCDLVIIDEPTRGIDVGAKHEIYLLINRLTEQGKSVVMISSELPEVLGMADRILVMRQGVIAGEISDVENATQQQIMALAAH